MKDVKIKSVIFAAAIMAIILCTVFSAVCINIDGSQSNAEWSDSELHVLRVPDDFGNDVSFAYVRIVFEPNAGKIFLCIGIEYKSINEPNLAGANVSLCGGAEIRLNADGTYECADESFTVKTASSCDTHSKNAVIEAEISHSSLTASYGSLKIKIIDTYGKSSNLYLVDFGAADSGNIGKNPVDKSSSSKKSKTTQAKSRDKSSRTVDDFTYKPAKNASESVALKSGEGQVQSFTEENVNALTDDFTAVLPNKNEKSKKLYIILGSVSAAAIAVAAVFDHVRKEKLSAEKRQNRQDEDIK